MGHVGQLDGHTSPSSSEAAAEAAADTDPVQAQTGAASTCGCKAKGNRRQTHVALGPATTVTDADEETKAG